MSTSGPAGPPAPGVPVCYRHAGREAHIRCQRCERPICPDCMRDAAVGFQCPTCIAEGARTTRQAQGAYGGARSANPALTSFVLIGTNLAVWLAIVVTGWSQSPLLGRLAISARGICESVSDPASYWRGVESAASCAMVGGGDGSWVPGVADGAYWQLVTSMFTHEQVWHIGANMLSLYVLGPQLEAALGRLRFVALYLLSGLSGSVAVYWLSGTEGYTLGASTAIFGLFGAFAVIVHKVGSDLRSIGGLLLVNVVITFLPGLSISWQGHLGGLVGGVVVTAALIYAPRGPRRAVVQGCLLFAFTALLALAVIARSAALA
ncbi:rhomboid family intramembrane serine protease [Nocardioides sp. 1609]|uniref:rhomboid family intramembrane serine protease n=1 Tax=Nocardioides sp. 1609 TaxID=2508327 RepID=UPI00106FDA24|nr:rhomboid family intramembrane serine protease [Nocardioides sp. 1609]